MNLPSGIKTDINFTNDDGTPRNDIAIYKDYLVCHPDMLQSSLDMFETLTGQKLEVIEKGSEN